MSFPHVPFTEPAASEANLRGALVLVRGRRGAMSVARAAALAGLSAGGADVTYGVARVGPKSTWAFRGSWTRDEIEAARARGVDIAVDVSYCSPEEYESPV